MTDYFARLGAEVQRAWLAVDREPELLPEIAEEVLGRLPPSACFDREAFLRAELDPLAAARRERAPLGAFGQPGVTVYFGRDFVIEVYLWIDSLSGIHDHPFRGLFAILEGHSVHARYAFEERERVGARMRIGALEPKGIELLEAGDHRLFSADRHPLIHTLIHVPVPSISMVIRTVRSTEYWRFLPPSIALLHDEPDAVIARQLAVLEFLRQTNDPRFGEHLERYLSSSDLETSLSALFPFWPVLDSERRAHLLDIIRERHGARADALEPALGRVVRGQQANALRQMFRDPDDRLVATALLCAEDRAQVLSVLARRHDDPAARLHRFVDEHGALASDESTAEAVHGLIDGGGRAGLERHIEERFGAETLAAQRPQIARFCLESPFAPLVG